MNKDVERHIGGTFGDAARLVADAWRRAEANEAVSEDHLIFVNWEAFSRTMTPKRLELLRHLHRYPQASISALAKSLKRDHRRVDEGVAIL